MSPHIGIGGAAALLRRAHTLLTPTSAWTQGDFARAANGDRAPIGGALASCWCIEGALLQVAGDESIEALELARQALLQTLGLRDAYGLTLAGWNDFTGRTHQEVLDVLVFTASRLERDANGVAA